MTIDLMEWIKKDFVIIILCLLALLACLYTLYAVGSYQEQINQAWQQQWNISGCMADPVAVNITFNIGGLYNESKNINQDS